MIFQENKEAFIQKLLLTDIFELKGEIPAAIHNYDFPSGPLVQLKNVSVQYDGRPIVNNINWQINPGRILAIDWSERFWQKHIIVNDNSDNPKAYGQDMILFGRKKGTGETVWDIKEKIGYFTIQWCIYFQEMIQ